MSSRASRIWISKATSYDIRLNSFLSVVFNSPSVAACLIDAAASCSF